MNEQGGGTRLVGDLQAADGERQHNELAFLVGSGQTMVTQGTHCACPFTHASCAMLPACSYQLALSYPPAAPAGS